MNSRPAHGLMSSHLFFCLPCLLPPFTVPCKMVLARPDEWEIALGIFKIFSLEDPRSGELRTQKLKSHLVRTQNLNVLLLKPGVGQYITIHATLTARDFFLTYFYTFGPFTCIFFPNLSRFFPVFAVADTGSCVGLQNKIGHPAGCRFPC